MKRIKEWILGCVGLILGFLGVNLLIFKILFPGPKSGGSRIPMTAPWYVAIMWKKAEARPGS